MEYGEGGGDDAVTVLCADEPRPAAERRAGRRGRRLARPRLAGAACLAYRRGLALLGVSASRPARPPRPAPPDRPPARTPRARRRPARTSRARLALLLSRVSRLFSRSCRIFKKSARNVAGG